jgi:opacity protein-like surface antigen
MKLDAEVGWQVRGRVGLGWDRFLIYGTGGWAYADIDANYHRTTRTTRTTRNSTRTAMIS